MKRIIILVIAILSVSFFAIMRCNAKKNNDAQQEAISGGQLYNDNCKICHGVDGKAGMAGATDLSQSKMMHDEAVAIVTKGRNGMRSFQNQLSKDEIEAIVQHIETFRK